MSALHAALRVAAELGVNVKSVKFLAEEGTMSLVPSTIPSNYRISKCGRLGRSLDEEVRDEKQAQDDEGPRELVTVEVSVDASDAEGGAEA